MKHARKILALFLALCMGISSVPLSVGAAGLQEQYVTAKKDVRNENAGGDVVSAFSRINVKGEEDGVYALKQAEFSAKNMEIELVYDADIVSGDIVVEPSGDVAVYGTEGYSVTVGSDVVTVNAATDNGAAYGLQEILRQLDNGSVVSVEVTKPFKEVRGLFVDCARKYFSVEWFEEMIREMAWSGLNTLYLSFSNDEGFRFLLDDMSISFDNGAGETVSYSDEFMTHLGDNPESVADSAFLTERNASATDEGSSRIVTNYDNNCYLTQDEMVRILSYAKAYGINVIPELNSPGHFGQVMWYFPEYRIRGTWYSDGQPHYGLDLTNKEAFNFGTALVKKYIDFFAEQGCTSFCIGGDEYDQGAASNAQVAEYTNGLAEYAESKGMTVFAWNDGQAAQNNLLKDSVIVNNWNGSSNYTSVNFNSNYLYYVLKSYNWKPDAKTLYDTWTPLSFYDGEHANTEKVAGASLAIWCDQPSRETPEFILESILPSVRAFGYRMWNFSEDGNSYDTYATYEEFEAASVDAPEVASAIVLAAAGYEIKEGDNTGGTSNELQKPSADGGYELVIFPTAVATSNVGWYGIDNGGSVIDGDKNSIVWTSDAQAAGHYIRVDIGQLQNIETVLITSPAHGDVCTNADVQVSEDGQNWVTVGAHSGSSAQSITDSYIVNKDIRYIQVLITEAKVNWWQLAEIAWTPESETAAVIENGTYIIVNDTNRVMTSTVSGSGLASAHVSVLGTVASPLNKIYEWNFERQEDGTYYISDCNGNYLNISNFVISVSASPQKITMTFVDGKVQLSNSGQAVNYYKNSGEIFSGWYEDVADINNQQTLYKKAGAPSLKFESLHEVIQEAQSLNNDDMRYDAEAFEKLQVVLAESIAVYEAAVDPDTALTQEEVDAQTEKLKAEIVSLKFTDAYLDYIEIPIEILDFRADGIMFEYAQNESHASLYELLRDDRDWGEGLTYANAEVRMPGYLGNRITEDEWEGWVDNCRRIGLVEDYLVNGHPVYKKETINYIAVLIAKGYFTNLGDSVENWNSTISEKIIEMYAGYDAGTDTNSNFGSWEEMLAKTSTGENGGDMAWSSVSTCYDLAYYVLTNMWRPTEGLDKADGISNGYNKVVEDRRILRLLEDVDGNYRLDSMKEIYYNGEYICNLDLTTENSAETKFAPINDLGYEDEESFGDTTDVVKGTNNHFTIHAQGMFIYNVDENLYFYFDGDDDVYFYVNGKLAMDIGGAHSHCDDMVFLNDIADEFGLEDGGVYSFDMFYAERHTTQANLEFDTNIKIMDTSVITSKTQYNDETLEMIGHGAVVDVGTTVAYSFNILNQKDVELTNISFVDETLGTYLSGDVITLSDPNKTNGKVTTIDDMYIFYNTYDRPSADEEGTVNGDKSQLKSYEEMVVLINAANGSQTSLPTGSYQVSVGSEDELKGLLVLGVPRDTQISVYGVKRAVSNNDRPYVNTVLSRAYYMTGDNKAETNGIASRKLTVLNSFRSVAEKETVVIDYGKKVQIPIVEISDNLALNDNVSAEFYGFTLAGEHGQIRLGVTGIGGTDLDVEYRSSNSQGVYVLKGDDGVATMLEFQAETFMSHIDKVYAVYQITDDALDGTDYATYYVLLEVDIIPATNVYYETDFTASTDMYDVNAGDDSEKGVFVLESREGETKYPWNTVSVIDDAAPEGVQDSYHYGTEVYGYDQSYLNDKYQSNGSSLYVVGRGVRTKKNTENFTEARFSFTGTGFDIISRTGPEEGAIRVDIYSDEARAARVKSVTVLNKSESDLTLYQIPVASVDMNEYGTYYVTVSVNAAYEDEEFPVLNRGGNFYFDAIRIYNPIDVSKKDNSYGDSLTAYQAYCADGEADMQLTEVRDILLSSEHYDTENGIQEGVVFVDKYYGDGNIPGVAIGDYRAIGPNNEVYLAEGQGIAFKLKADTIPHSVDVGVKAVNGEPATMVTKIAESVDENAEPVEKITGISSATAQFYGLADSSHLNSVFNSEGEAYVVIQNTGKGLLSITDIKIAYGVSAEPLSVMFLVDDMVVANASAFMLSDHVSEEVPEDQEDLKEDVSSVFPDVVDGEWYENAVQYVYDRKFMVGSNGLFKPTGNITRAQVVKTLYNLEGSPAVTDFRAVDELTDVQEGQWYTDAVCWAYNIGVAKGNDYTKMFDMDAPVTRQQLATFFYRYAEYKGLDITVKGDYSELAGAEEVAFYAEDAMKWTYGTGLITGSRETVGGVVVYDLKPLGTATRAQMVVILQRFIENIQEKTF